MEGSTREARLRPQYASLYPALEAGTWQAASAIGRQLLLWHLTASIPPEGERLMSEEHFEFRGGAPRNGSEANARTRQADHPAA
jgi:hypothetical protein